MRVCVVEKAVACLIIPLVPRKTEATNERYVGLLLTIVWSVRVEIGHEMNGGTAQNWVGDGGACGGRQEQSVVVDITDKSRTKY